MRFDLRVSQHKDKHARHKRSAGGILALRHFKHEKKTLRHARLDDWAVNGGMHVGDNRQGLRIYFHRVVVR